MTTFTNSFHNTEIEIRAKVGEIVSAATYRKVCRALCSPSDCQCGTFRGSVAWLEETPQSYQRFSGPREYRVSDANDPA